MSDEPAFQELIGRVRSDAAAAAELVRCYEPVLRRMVRVRGGMGTGDIAEHCPKTISNIPFPLESSQR